MDQVNADVTKALTDTIHSSDCFLHKYPNKMLDIIWDLRGAGEKKDTFKNNVVAIAIEGYPHNKDKLDEAGFNFKMEIKNRYNSYLHQGGAH